MTGDFILIANVVTIISVVTLCFLITWAVRTCTKLKADPTALKRIKVLFGASTAVALVMTLSFLAPSTISQLYIEPVGGVDSDAVLTQRMDTKSAVADRAAEIAAEHLRRLRDNRNGGNNRSTDETNSRPQTTGRDTPARENDQQRAARAEEWTRTGILASILRTERVIVHTAYARLVVGDINIAIDHITGLAAKYNGWLVSSSQSADNTGQAAIRVPAEDLQDSLKDLQRMAIGVESMDLSSEDVTEDYVDTESKLKVLQTAETNYIRMIEEADNIQHNLTLQQRITEIQTEMEQLQGRLRYLTTVSAFSLINVDLKLAPAGIRLDAGEDRTVQVNAPILLDAVFTPPNGMEDFEFEWDFGDTSAPVSGRVTALIDLGTGQRLTNPVEHYYVQEGRHIVQVSVKGRAKGQLAEGKDTLIVTAKEVPVIRASFPVERMNVVEGELFGIQAAFTKPQELHSYQVSWDFGDGSPTAVEPVPEGANRNTGNHRYTSGTGTYTALFTVSAQSQAGRVTAQEEIYIYVAEPDSLIGGSWDIGNWAKGAFKAMFTFLSFVVMVLIWTAIFSPIIIVPGVGYVLYKMFRNNQFEVSHN